MTTRAETYLGLDLGGTGVKAGVFAADGGLLAVGHRTYTPAVSAEGHAEIPIETIYAAARDAVREAVSAAGARVAAMAVASQGQTFVALDENDDPLHPAILWYDSRAAAEAEHLRATLRESGAQPAPFVNTIATAPKILWLREHRPAVRRARRFLLLPEYVSYRLTGEAVTDANTAASTGLCVEGALEHHPAALAAAALDAAQLARIARPGTPIANLRPAAAAEWGLDAKTLLVAGANDQYAGALGAGNCRAGILTETTGACLALVTLTRAASLDLPPGLYAGPFPIPGYRFILAYAKTAGLLLDWFRREFAPGETLANLDALAAASPPGSRGLTVLPHFDGAVSPKPNPDARGAVCNLTLNHTRADIYRAILEAITFSLRENLAALAAAGFDVEVVRAIGGGAKSDFWLQMKADVCGRPVERPAVTEAAVFGAAMLAAVGASAFADVAECSRSLYRVARTFSPDAERHAAYEPAWQRYLEHGRCLYGGMPS